MTALNRRKVLIAAGASASATVLALIRPGHAGGASPPAETGAPAQQPPADALPPHSEQYAEALNRILQGRTASETRVVVDIPPTVENGNIVPYKLDVEDVPPNADTGAASRVPSQETPSGPVERLYLLSTRNPQPLVATFHFTPLSGKPAVTGRMRLAKSQEVVAVAETTSGEVLIGRRKVEVEIAGCATE